MISAAARLAKQRVQLTEAVGLGSNVHRGRSRKSSRRGGPTWAKSKHRAEVKPIPFFDLLEVEVDALGPNRPALALGDLVSRLSVDAYPTVRRAADGRTQATESGFFEACRSSIGSSVKVHCAVPEVAHAASPCQFPLKKALQVKL